MSRISQLFARSISSAYQDFKDGFQIVSAVDDIVKNDFSNIFASKGYNNISVLATWNWDNRATANLTKKGKSNTATPNPPVIASVGDCIGSSCKEKNEGKFSVNNQDFGEIIGLGSKHINATFYVHADKNQMPLRNLVIDWGDDSSGWSEPWPRGSESGSIANNNFYKNRRGMSSTNPPQDLCNPDLPVSDPSGFGGTPEACSSGYVLFNHDYTCTNAQIQQLQAQPNRACTNTFDKNTGSITISPCLGKDENGKQLLCKLQGFKHNMFSQNKSSLTSLCCTIKKALTVLFVRAKTKIRKP